MTDVKIGKQCKHKQGYIYTIYASEQPHVLQMACIPSLFYGLKSLEYKRKNYFKGLGEVKVQSKEHSLALKLYNLPNWDNYILRLNPSISKKKKKKDLELANSDNVLTSFLTFSAASGCKKMMCLYANSTRSLRLLFVFSNELVFIPCYSVC